MVVDILKKAAIAGGEVLRKYFKKGVATSVKTGIHDVVTIADKESQNAIIESINKSVRGTVLEGITGFMAEEGFYRPAEYLFVIDPLDGTTNFSAGMSFFSIPIAVFKNEELIAAIVYEAIKDSFYHAEKRKGAYKDGKKITIPKNKILEDSLLIFNPSAKLNMKRSDIKFLGGIIHSFRGFRTLGSVALEICRVCEGEGDIVFSGTGPSLWDIAASRLILEESGGEMKNLDGSILKFEVHNVNKKYGFIAGEEKLLKEFIGLVKKNAGYQGGGEGR